MPDITKELTGDIVNKLRRTPEDAEFSAFEVSIRAGAKHDVCSFRYRGVYIGQFGIQRGSKKDTNHSYIADQMHLSKKQGYDFAKCTLSLEDYIRLLVAKQQIANH